jgi:uncharacterized protein (TIGR02271 family)
MSTTIVAGVFTQEAAARRALDALRQAGFGYDQVGVAMPGRGNINLLNDLLDLGVPRDQASYYAQQLGAGNTVVSVRPDGKDQQAHDILHQYGGYDYEHQNQGDYTSQGTAATSAAYAQGTTGATDVNAAYAGTDNEFHQPRSLRLRAEQLNVNKERVQAGEVRLRKDVVEEQQTVNVPVTHEEVYIERRPVTDASVDNTPIGEGETIRVPVTEEQVNVTKNTVVTGEVAVGKREVQETQQVTDTVRHEEARVVREGNVDVEGNVDNANTLNDPNNPNNTNRRSL